MSETQNLRSLSTLGFDIRKHYREKGKPVYYAAKPYVDALVCLADMSDYYGMDDAESVVIYGLSNLSTMRGGEGNTDAKRIRYELKMHLHNHNPSRYKAPKA